MGNTPKKGIHSVGIDEVGRGPLAGPVAVGVVRTHLSRKEYTKLLSKIRDSKKASEKERMEWYKKALEWKKSGLIDFNVVFQSSKHIDLYGIVPAIRLCMQKGIKNVFGKNNDEYLLDGGLRLSKEYVSQKTIIRGDSKEPLIAFAATIAKVIRDKYMVLLAKKYPEYGFAEHKGYGTKVHRANIKKYGLSLVHRKTFCKRITLR